MTEKQKNIAIFCHGNRPMMGAIKPALLKANLSWEIFQLAKGDKPPESVDDFDGVILMGGNMGVYERDEHTFLEVEMAWTKKMIKAGKPVFGVCLGCQMLAYMHNGEVFAGDKGFCVGFRDLHVDHSDEVFGYELEGKKGFSWHGDTYTIADDCERLITGCEYHEQAVKFSSNVYGVQFHPEVTKEIIDILYVRDMKSGKLPACAKPMHVCLEDANKSLPPVHAWLEKFISRLFCG